MPVWATTWAMPVPMMPAPTTAIFRTLMMEILSGALAARKSHGLGKPAS
jgi:hypothetical protein